jgi:uncharacterized protein (DUF1015 family)
MVRIKPFAALRPRADLVERVACVPYDVVNTEEARKLASREPLSFLHVTRAEVDLPHGIDSYNPEVYERAAANFQKLQGQGVLVRDLKPYLYIYRQEAALLGVPVCQTGVVGCFHIDDYLGNVIKKHENTRPDKEDDRTRHTLALKANPGLVFLLHEENETIAELIEQAVKTEPLYKFMAADGVCHTVWRAHQRHAFAEAFSKLACAYIADGHHRSASAARAGAELRAANPNHRGDEEYNWFLGAIFSKKQLTILPYHRLVKDLNGMNPIDALKRVNQLVALRATDTFTKPEAGEVGMYLERRWYHLRLAHAAGSPSDPVASLEYQLLSEQLLRPVFGINDIKTDQRIEFVGGIRGIGELQKRVDSGEAAVAFAMPAVSVDQLIRVADAGQTMPPKSTWFEPKLRSGLLIHLF